MDQRVELLKENETIKQYEGLAEEIVNYEARENKSFGNDFSFSAFSLDYYGFPLYMGKIDNIFFLAVKPPEEKMMYTFFKNKKHFKIYVATEIEEEDRLDFINLLDEL